MDSSLPLIKIYDNRLLLLFLKNKNFLNILETFKNFVFAFVTSFSEKKVNTSESGIAFSNENVVNLSEKIHSFLLKESKKNLNLCIKNNQIESIYYILIEMDQYPNVQILCSWQFVCSPVEKSRELWASSNGLKLFNCCIRNYALDLAQKSSSYQTILETKLAESAEQLKSSCCFPKKFIEIDSSFYVYFLGDPLETQKVQSVLDSSFQKQDITGEKISSIFLYFHQLVRDNNKQIPVHFQTVLTQLNNENLYNLNCKNLFLSLSLDKQVFKDFLVDCLFNICVTEKLIFSKNQKLTLKTTLLGCEYIFK